MIITYLDTPSATPAGNDAVLVTVLASQAGTNQSIDSGFTMDIGFVQQMAVAMASFLHE